MATVATPAAALPVPATLVAGLAGAGKTTFINALARARPPGERWAVVLAAALPASGIDAPGVEVASIGAGCLCCGGLVPFRVGLTRLLRRLRDATPHRLIIETDPQSHAGQLRRALAAPAFLHLLRVEQVIAVIDQRNFAAPVPITIDPLRELRDAADLLVATMDDAADGTTRARMRAFARIAPEKPLLFSAHGRATADTACAAVGQ
jgi:G3E family GTPase